jgi:hypothetical protein
MMGLFDRFLKRLGFKGKATKQVLSPEGRAMIRGDISGTSATKRAVIRGIGRIKDKIPTVRQFEGRTALEDFLYFGVWYSDFSSSNVAAFRYLEDPQILFVRFKNGAVYGYEPVNPQMAMGVWRASSKGGWVWDKLRIRGTAYGHQVNYYYDQGQSTHIPLYRLEGGEREARHDREALEEGGKYTGFFTGGTPGRDEL